MTVLIIAAKVVGFLLFAAFFIAAGAMGSHQNSRDRY